jgi:hypothetical protein
MAVPLYQLPRSGAVITLEDSAVPFVTGSIFDLFVHSGVRYLLRTGALRYVCYICLLVPCGAFMQ